MRSQAQYRISFALQLVGAFLLSFGDFLAILVIFQHLPLLGGWSLEEVAFLYGTSYVSFKLTDMVLGHADDLPQYIRTGAFDSFLLRPLGSLFQLLTADFELKHAGALLQGLLVLAYSVTQAPIDWDPPRVAMLIVMLGSGAVIFGAVWIVANTIVFWVIDTREIANAFTYGSNELTQYPLHIFGGWLRRIATFVVPVGFVNYFPALYILDRPDPLGAPRAVSFLSPLVAIAAVLVAARIWGWGVRHYRSTGS